MSGHTPGPWRIGGTALQPNVSTKGWFTCGFGACDFGAEKELEANVRLVAAAPDMFKALILAERLTHTIMPQEKQIVECAKAIKKAMDKAEGRG